MEEIPDEVGLPEHRYPKTAWWPSDYVEKFGSVSLYGKEEIMRNREPTEREYDRLSSRTASQILWKTGTLSEPIPNGFYSVVPVSTETYNFFVLLLVSRHSFCLIKNSFCPLGSEGIEY